MTMTISQTITRLSLPFSSKGMTGCRPCYLIVVIGSTWAVKDKTDPIAKAYMVTIRMAQSVLLGKMTLAHFNPFSASTSVTVCS